MFGRKKTSATSSVEMTKTHPEREGAKNRPTPKRREAQAANLRPIVPSDRKAAAKAARERARRQRDTERVAVVRGDEGHLPARDAGPERRMVRDLVDARWNFGELYLPFMLLFVVGILIPIIGKMSVQNRASFSLTSSLLLYLLILVLTLDTFIMWRRVRTALRERFGQELVLRGLFAYSLSRSVMIRRWRRPPTRVARGEAPRR